MSNPVPPSIQWSNQPLQRWQGTEHFLVVGASGSGKTTLLKVMMQSVFTADVELTGFVYDPKQELVPLLFSLRGDTPDLVEAGTSSVRILNPFDERCSVWELYKDIDGPVSARQFASILIPDPQSSSGTSEQFFTNAVRDILTAVILVFINCAKDDCNWTFRDLLLGMLYRPYLKLLLEQTRTRAGTPFPIAHRVKETYFGEDGDPRTQANILATISATLSVYEPVAAAWHQAQKRDEDRKSHGLDAYHSFSLKDWKEGIYSDILVLGNDEAGRSSIDPINRAIFRRAAELTLAKREMAEADRQSGEKQTWFFLDEIREAGYMDGLSSLLTKGRSKGACAVLAFQDIEGLRDVYGEEVANEICGQCNHTIVLRLNSPTTAQWASDLFGKRIALGRSGGSQGSGLQMQTGFEEQERPFYHSADFIYLPPALPHLGLTGFVRSQVSPDQQPARWTLTPPELQVLKPADPPDDNWLAPVMPVDPAILYLTPWDQEDWDRLGFTAPEASSDEAAAALGLRPPPPPPSQSGKAQMP